MQSVALRGPDGEPQPGLESQGRAASMPRLAAETQVGGLGVLLVGGAGVSDLAEGLVLLPALWGAASALRCSLDPVRPMGARVPRCLQSCGQECPQPSCPAFLSLGHPLHPPPPSPRKCMGPPRSVPLPLSV